MNQKKEKSINVLITSVSRKVWLVKLFKDAINNLKIQGSVVSVDADPLSAGFFVSDKYYVVPASDSKNFLTKILDICQKEEIKLIVPTRDGELTFFAENKRFFGSKGVKVLVSEVNVIKTCRDKYLFSRFVESAGLSSPKTILTGQIDYSPLDYPVIIKPRTGSGGKNAFKVENSEEFKFFEKYVFDSIVQEFVEGKEYTVDVLSDFEGRVLSIVPRERIEIINGESYKSRTVKDKNIIENTKLLVEKLGTIGHVTVQCFVKGNKIEFLEVNPRFGGAAALGVAAGANTPLLILKLLAGETVKPIIGEFEEGVVMLRFTDDFFLRNGLKL